MLATLVHDLHCTAGTPQTLHRRLFLVPHCTLRLSHLSVGGNTRGMEMVWPTRHVGAGLRGLLGPIAHGLLGRRHPGPRLSHMVGWGCGLKYRDSQIFVRGAWHVLSYLGVWSLGLFSPIFFSTSTKKKIDQEGGLPAILRRRGIPLPSSLSR